MFAVPAETPVTIPVPAPTEALALPLDHVPPVLALLSVVVKPTHTLRVPEITGLGLTVTAIPELAVQPPALVATSEDEYLAVVRGKTAALFAAACEVGPILAQKGKPEIEASRSYGTNLGIAFQLIDDALDYGGVASKLGKNTGDDFREGKITLPVVLSYRRGTDAERAFWKRCLEQGQHGGRPSQGDFVLGL